VVSHVVARDQPRGMPELYDRLVKPIFLCESNSKVEVCLCEVRVQGKRLSQFRYFIVVIILFP
jgi:hypothetical protein